MINLSVVMPYDGNQHTPALLFALADQLDHRDELVVVSECSTDALQELAKIRFKSALQFLTFTRPSGFVAHTAGIMRNLGALAARSDLEMRSLSKGDVASIGRGFQ